MENQAFNGHPKKNPFSFQHFNLNFLTVNTDMQQFPSQPLKPKFEHKETHQGILQSLRGNGAKQLQSRTHHAPTICARLHTISHRPHTRPSGRSAHTGKYGNLRLEAHFAQTLQQPVNCICYAEFDNMIQIDHARNVIADFKPS